MCIAFVLLENFILRNKHVYSKNIVLEIFIIIIWQSHKTVLCHKDMKRELKHLNNLTDALFPVSALWNTTIWKASKTDG